MHYKNGREAKNGDMVVHTGYGIVGILSRINQGATCNGRVTPISQNDPYINIGEYLHLDDVSAADIPDSTQQSSASQPATDATS